MLVGSFVRLEQVLRSANENTRHMCTVLADITSTMHVQNKRSGIVVKRIGVKVVQERIVRLA